MAIKVTYPDGTTEIILEAVTVDRQNFHEGMFDFNDETGRPVKQISMDIAIKWELVDEPPTDAAATDVD